MSIIFVHYPDNYYNKWSNTTTPFNSTFTLTFAGNYNRPDGVLNTVTTSGHYYTFQISGLDYSDRQAVIMETTNAPQSFSTISQPLVVNQQQDVSINVTLAGSKSNEEKVFIRYSLNNWVSSKVVEAIGIGNTWTTATATIPSIDNIAGTTIKYYAYTTTVEATNTSNHDLITLKIENNGGSNYSYSVNTNWTANSSGIWSNSSTWNSGLIPPSDVPIVIDANITLDTDATVASLTINSGATFTASDASARTLTITKSITGSSTTLTNNGTWANGTGGSTVTFSGAPSAGDAVHAISGTIAFNNITINKTSGASNVGASFEVGSTITGTLEIGNGGYVSTAPPSGFYNSSAILKFNQGGSATYNVGASDNSWSTSVIPQNITISSGILNLAADRTATGNLFIDGGTLTLDATANPNLNIQGNWTRNAGVFNANTGTITLGGTTDGTVYAFDGSIMNNLVVAKTGGAIAKIDCKLTTAVLTINSAAILNVNPGKELTVSTTLTNSGALNLKSDVSGTASILTPTSFVSSGGTYSAEQYLATARNWYTSSPLSNAKAPTGFTYYQYVEPGNNSSFVAPATLYWKSINTGDLLTAGTGYIVQSTATPSTILFTTENGGTFNNETVNVTGLSRTTNATKLGFNLIGNPYPSYLNARTAINNAANLEKTLWYRTKDTNGGYVFDTYNTINNEGTNNNLAGNVIGTVAPMQAFWVRVKDGETSASITFTNSLRKHKPDTINSGFKAPAIAQQVLRLKVSNGTNSDETLLLFNPNALDTYDNYDSPKMMNNTASIPEIYTQVGNENLVINGMNSITYDTEIPLVFSTGEANTFKIKNTEFRNFDSNTKVYLKDKTELSETELNIDTEYEFNSAATTTTNRFALIFKALGSITNIDKNSANNDFYVFRNQNNKIAIHYKTELNQTITISNAMGQVIMSQSTNSNYTEIEKSLNAGLYLVTLKANGLTRTSKVIIN